MCPIDAAAAHLPEGLIGGLGIFRIQPENVILKNDKLDLALQTWRKAKYQEA